MRPSFVPNEFRIKHADAPWELRGCTELRHAVFCREQGLFSDSDADEIDQIAIPIVALSCVVAIPDTVVGTVRIHESAPGVWYGSRLAVHADFRGVALLGTELIHHAVRTAHSMGCSRFLAHVQQQNIPLFRRLHWSLTEMVTLHGRPHGCMQADLAYYPPRHEVEVSVVTTQRTAA